MATLLQEYSFLILSEQAHSVKIEKDEKVSANPNGDIFSAHAFDLDIHLGQVD